MSTLANLPRKKKELLKEETPKEVKRGRKGKTHEDKVKKREDNKRKQLDKYYLMDIDMHIEKAETKLKRLYSLKENKRKQEEEKIKKKALKNEIVEHSSLTKNDVSIGYADPSKNVISHK